MATTTRYSPEVRERAVRMVIKHEREYASQWAAIGSIAERIGCTQETLWQWVRRAERNAAANAVEPGGANGARSRDGTCTPSGQVPVRERTQGGRMLLSRRSAYSPEGKLDSRGGHPSRTLDARGHPPTNAPELLGKARAWAREHGKGPPDWMGYHPDREGPRGRPKGSA